MAHTKNTVSEVQFSKCVFSVALRTAVKSLRVTTPLREPFGIIWFTPLAELAYSFKYPILAAYYMYSMYKLTQDVYLFVF